MRCEKIIRIGLPKGNVYEKSEQFVASIIGQKIPEGKLAITYDCYVFYFLKHRDIPTLIEKGILDYGVTSDEWLVETGAELLRLKELNWCNTNISLIVHKNSFGQLENCVSEYVNIAKSYFKDEKMKIEYVSGSCEALVPTEFDCCVGCVESGGTLSQNNLIVRKVLLQSKIVLVGKEKINSDKMKIIYEKL